MRLLFVDDDPNMHRLVELMLRDTSYQLEIVSSARMALYKINSDSYDVIISDLQMPGMDGIALIKELRSKNFLQPVVIISAYGLEKMAEMAINSGASMVLEKPFRREQLLEAIEKLKANDQV